MRIGFANIYSWRPHVEHLYFLARLVEQAGHHTAFLTCDSSVSICYSRLLKDHGRLRECPACMLGGVRSYATSNVTSIRRGKTSLDTETLERVALSSSCTLTRAETQAEWDEPEVAALRQGLYEPIAAAYESAVRWIEAERLEAVVCFNGRIDMTAAIVLACQHKGIPYVTHERSWFGDGFNLNPNANCLSIRALADMVAAFSDRPLTAAQAGLAGRLAAERFLRVNQLEWRIYNKDAVVTTWPLPPAAGPRVLVLPSSKNEFAGEVEWQAEWIDNTDALDDFMAAMDIKPEQVVLRCHPNWAEKIGAVEGNRSLAHYKAWCAKRGIHCISSESKASTYDLIQESDMVVLNGGSAAVEAGVCGKRVFCLGPAFYQSAGFAHMIYGRADLADPALRVPLDPDSVVRKALRFIFVSARRFPQYNQYVRGVETTRYAYFEGADAERLVEMLRSGTVEPDDASFAADEAGETPIVAALNARDWASLVTFAEDRPKLPSLDVGRRPALRWVDWARSKMARGDV